MPVQNLGACLIPFQARGLAPFACADQSPPMNAPIPLKDACAVQTLLSENGLTGACVSAGHLVIVEINAPADTAPEKLTTLLNVGNSKVADSVLKSCLSCVRQYPDKSLKMDLHFSSREEASTFLQVARATQSSS